MTDEKMTTRGGWGSSRVLLSGGLVLGGFALGCEPAPLVAGGRQTCVTDDGRVRCWGYGQYGVLGYGNTQNIGDNETPASAGDVIVGGDVAELALGYYHSCARLESGAVRCWGRNADGQLGRGHTNDIGDNEHPYVGANVSLGGTATQITAGVYHTCALLSTGNVRCWGQGRYGALGYGNTNNIGDDEAPSSVGTVNVGGTVAEIKAGSFHTCARLTSGAVRCWGSNWTGQLGYGHTNTIGDDETPASAGNVPVGVTVDSLALGEMHTCARSGAHVKCWGHGGYGQLGYANTNNVSLASSAGFVNVGGDVSILTAASTRTCVLTEDLEVRCWGDGVFGALGYGNQNSIGDNEHPASAGAVDVGGPAISLSAGYSHTCALINDDEIEVRCWGNGFGGKLGYAAPNHVGDNELPSSVPYAIVR